MLANGKWDLTRRLKGEQGRLLSYHCIENAVNLDLIYLTSLYNIRWAHISFYNLSWTHALFSIT
jgi:hypothetical protein